ncbi:MAG: hypothetical protein L3J68_00165 [Thermoplasmata archaeon]|nr:hypothetical protein [Thermoplasmata archaeon]
MSEHHRLSSDEIASLVGAGLGICCAFRRGGMEEYEPKLYLLLDPAQAFTDPSDRQIKRFEKAREYEIDPLDFCRMLTERHLEIELDTGGFPQTVAASSDPRHRVLVIGQ